LIERLAVAKSELVLIGQVEALLRSWDLDNAALVRLSLAVPPDVAVDVLLDCRDEAWQREYARAGGAAADPFLLAAATRSDAFTWSDLIAVAPDVARHPIFELAGKHGRSEGLVVPLASIDGSVAALITTGRDVQVNQESRRTIAVAAAVAFQRLLALKRSRPAQREARLSPREAEVLRWITAGKSDWQIGQILNISPKTANYHAENVKRKLGVATRMQAVVATLGGKLSG
jgi:LuxR family quorum sensing-dependent transcriptional regulator